MAGIFVAGTDTGVGKTYVAAALARSLRLAGKKIGVMKPVASGCTREGGRLVSADVAMLKTAAEVSDAVDEICPYYYEAPLAPNWAARVDGAKQCDPVVIHRAYETLSKRHDHMIVEGVGGLLVPLTDRYLVADLIADLHLPVVLVSRCGLGCINHTLLSLEALAARSLAVRAVVFNYNTLQQGIAEQTNFEHLTMLLPDIPVIALSHGQAVFPALSSHAFPS